MWEIIYYSISILNGAVLFLKTRAFNVSLEAENETFEQPRDMKAWKYLMQKFIPKLDGTIFDAEIYIEGYSIVRYDRDKNVI